MLKNLLVLLALSSCIATTEADTSQAQQATSGGFVLTTSPTFVNIPETGQASFTVNVSPYGGFVGTVTLSPVGLPSNTTASFNPQPVMITGTNSVNVTMTMTTNAAPTGAYLVDVFGDDGAGNISQSANCCANLQVGTAPDWSLSVTPASITVNRGQAATYTDVVTANSAFSGTVSLQASGAPGHTTTTFTPSLFTLSPSGVGSGTMKVQTASNTPRGTFSVTVTSSHGFGTHSQAVTLVVK